MMNGWLLHGSSSAAYYGYGNFIFQHNDDQLVLKTGKNYVVSGGTAADKYVSLNSAPHYVGSVTSLFFRVKVWKAGKLNK